MTTPDSATYLRLRRLIGRVLDQYTQEALLNLIPILQNKEPLTMADIQTALADLDTAVKGVAERSTADVAALQAQIDELKAAGVDTAQLQAVADSIEANVEKLNAIDPVADVPAPDVPADSAPADPAAPTA